MRSFLQKALARGLSPQNIISYIHLRLSRSLCGCWGLLRLRLKAALLGVHVGRGVQCFGTVILGRWPGSRIDIGDGASLVSSAQRATAATVHAPVRLRTHGPEARIILGEGVELSGTSITARSQTIRIGRHAMLAPNCIITDSDFHAQWPPERRHLDPGYENDAPVHIGDHVWIGLNCIILKGVTIGEGAIVGAGSVVTHDVAPRTLVAGTPARFIRNLTPQEDA